MRGPGTGFMRYWGLARQALVPDHDDTRAVRRLALEMRKADRRADRESELIDLAGPRVANALREAVVEKRNRPDAYGRWRIVVILPGRTGFYWSGKASIERDRLAKIYGLKPTAASAAYRLLRDLVQGAQ